MMKKMTRRADAGRSNDRGDVPGWVLVTLMTAGLVTSIWLLADGQLNDILTRALASVHV